MQAGELGPRFQPELLGQPLSQLAIAVQCFALAVGPVERTQLQGTKPLPQRIPSDEVTELAGQQAVLPEREPRLGPFLQRDQPFLRQPLDRRPGERLVGEVGQRRTPPQRQRIR